MTPRLQDQGETRKESREHHGQAVAASDVQGRRSTAAALAVRGPGSCGRRCRLGAGAGVAARVVCIRRPRARRAAATACARRRRRRGGCGASAAVGVGRVLGTAQVVHAAGGLAGRVTGRARCHTLISIFGAFEVWDRLRVPVGARGFAVSAGALIAEGGLPRQEGSKREM